MKAIYLLAFLNIFTACNTSYNSTNEEWETEPIYASADSSTVIACRIVQFKGEHFDGVFPATIDGIKVEEIAGKERVKSIFPNPKDTTLTTLDFSKAKYLKALKNDAFYGCKYVKTVILNKTLEHLGNGSFADCKSIAYLEMGDKISYIGEGAFYNLDLLTDIKLPEALDTLGAYAFYSCGGIRHLEFNKGLKYIGDRAFANSKNVSFEKFPRELSYIGGRAFLNNTALKNVKLYDKVRTIEDKAFYKCSKLYQLNIRSANTKIGPQTFDDTPLMTDNNAIINYPKAAIYPEEEHWSKLKAKFLAE